MEAVDSRADVVGGAQGEEVIDQWLRDQLFDRVPSAIAVIDTHWNVVRANRAFADQFGEWQGRKCYEVYKGQKRKCSRCMASRTFGDGRVRTRLETGVGREGRDMQYIVQILPVVLDGWPTPYLVEISTDITREVTLQEELERVNLWNRTLIERSGDAILAMDTHQRVTVWNPAAADLFGLEEGELLGKKPPEDLLPPTFNDNVLKRGETCEIERVDLRRHDGTLVPAHCYGVALEHDGARIGSAVFFQDLRQVEQLEKEKLDAERLAAVGQTVAGLAHGVKNILTGLEGGMYLMRTGIEKQQDTRVRTGFEMLNRNIGRVTTFVRTLLEFSRGKAVKAVRYNPVSIAEDVVFLFRDAALRENIDLMIEPGGNVEPAPVDPDGIHTCLANLVTNALDACRMSETTEPRVRVRVREAPDKTALWQRRGEVSPATSLVFEVQDNGAGMDYEVKHKVFTNFFTTKGERGTGLGLLETRKIVQEHGGTIELESEPGKGTTFRIILPRRRLPRETV